MNIYGFYENGELVDQGDVKKLGKKYIIDPSSIYNHERTGKLLFGKYSVALIGVSKEGKPAHPETKARLATSFEEKVQDVARHLRIYGNTTLPKIKNGELDKWLDALREKGYECDVKAYSSRTGREIKLDGSPFDKGKYNTNYIVSLRRN